MTFNVGGWYLNPPFTLRTLTPLSVVKTLGGGVGLVTNPPLVLTMLQWSSFDVLTFLYLITSPFEVTPSPPPFLWEINIFWHTSTGFSFPETWAARAIIFGANLLQAHGFYLLLLFLGFLWFGLISNHVWRSREWNLSHEQATSYRGPGLEVAVGKSGRLLSLI